MMLKKKNILTLVNDCKEEFIQGVIAVGFNSEYNKDKWGFVAKEQVVSRKITKGKLHGYGDSCQTDKDFS